MNTEIRKFRRVLRVFERTVEKQLQADCECCGVSAVQCHTLLELQEAGTITNGQLAVRLDLDKSTVSRGIEDLVRKGLVNRQRNCRSRRLLDLSLTREGQAVCQVINANCDDYYGRLLEYLSATEKKSVVLALEALATAMKRARKEIDWKLSSISQGCVRDKKDKNVEST
jgi:DNA-binding MarR family transcriptional regulator